ncbi:Cof subfamily protein (haloacid dehalogenase superfamily) [Sporomusaceae bacterium BoRhaA]|uniref:Cof-type HAD-IIB family hydrolase n=1 Tax=Pelorhabdus rhamnosifermentans TaxID=2772457 RepID=UPI001C061A52|nr:Cof-type HAD-IIB family hydrolase [Pelorhabdus rhamnosifermentans]MBU2700053.1 Cof subfamily protein (haloacid dehalogenase superfamily) [Pelorhabdus rhamnosifermentans]
MAYKLVCIDVDGTLLNNKHKITKRTKEILLKAHKLGIHIVISTGRIYTDAEYYSDLIGVKSPVIASNGAFIKERNNNEVIYKDVLGESLSLELLKIFHKHRINPYFCTPYKFYYGNIMFKLFNVATKILGGRSNKIDIEYVYSWKRWQKVLYKEKDNIVKCEIIYRNPSLINELRKELKNIKELEIVDSSKYNIEITRKGISKGKAVAMLASFYNLKREEIISIGDSENDLSMIEYAGMGIAMGNALDSVKRKADYITNSNDNDGVANAINRFVLENKF